MATRNNNSDTAQKTTTRRPGRPSNASKQAAIKSQAEQMFDVAFAAASATAKTLMGMGVIEGGVQSIGIPQSGIDATSASQTGTGSGTQSRSASTGQKRSTVTEIGKKSPGRKVQSDSKATLTREFYDENLKAANPLTRAEFVAAATKKFGYSKQTANTYVSTIEKNGGYKLVSRSDPSKRGQNRGKQSERKAA